MTRDSSCCWETGTTTQNIYTLHAHKCRGVAKGTLKSWRSENHTPPPLLLA